MKKILKQMPTRLLASAVMLYPFAPEIDYEVRPADGRGVELTAFGKLMRDAAGISSSAVEKLNWMGMAV